MNTLISDNSIEVRLEPLSKKNRAKRAFSSKDTGQDGDLQEFIDKLHNEKDRIFSERMVQRRGSLKSCLNLEYVFWRIRNDKYVK